MDYIQSLKYHKKIASNTVVFQYKVSHLDKRISICPPLSFHVIRHVKGP